MNDNLLQKWILRCCYIDSKIDKTLLGSAICLLTFLFKRRVISRHEIAGCLQSIGMNVVRRTTSQNELQCSD